MTTKQGWFPCALCIALLFGSVTCATTSNAPGVSQPPSRSEASDFLARPLP